MIDRMPSRLLRRHICHSAQRGPGTGQVLGDESGGILVGLGNLRGRRSQFGKTKVENLGVTAGVHKDVGRLDVAVDDPLGMGRVESVGELRGDAEELRNRQGSLYRDGPEGSRLRDAP